MEGGAGYIAFVLTSLALHHYNGLPEVISLQREWVILAECWEFRLVARQHIYASA